MNDSQLDSPAAIPSFLAGADKLECQVPKAKRYAWIEDVLRRTGYLGLRKRDKTTIREYIRTMTGVSHSQLTRLIARYREHRRIRRAPSTRPHFPKKYTRADVLLLVQADEAHQTLSGPATKKLFERAYHLYQDEAYERLSRISVSHLYNLRKSNTYQRQRRHFSKTQQSAVKIGERRKPNTNNQPGFIRIDTVHQGEQDKQKGVYHINAIDEVTQFEIIISVERISERYLIPVLEEILKRFPFCIKGFHSDCGSEYINHRVAKLLNKLHIEFTKSRARHCHDNALAESKNGAIVRKYLGYVHIAQKWAPLINQFYREHLIPYLNYHRPYFFQKYKSIKKAKRRKYIDVKI